MKRIIKQLVFISTPIFVVSLTVLLSGCNDDASVEAPPLKAQTATVLPLDESNVLAFSHTMANEYLLLSDQLTTGYLRFKAAEDALGFVEFRNSQWTPIYIEKKTAYERMLFKHKAFIYRHQLNVLFEKFIELQRLSLHLKHSLLDKDWVLEQQVMTRLAEDRALMMKYRGKGLS